MRNPASEIKLQQTLIYSRTEMWVVLIVGCIPPIRPLLMMIFHKVLTTARSGLSNKKNTSTPTELRYQSAGTKATAKTRTQTTGTELGSSLPNSEENILADDNGRIVKTTDISLSYDRSAAFREPDYYGQTLPNERL